MLTITKDKITLDHRCPDCGTQVLRDFGGMVDCAEVAATIPLKCKCSHGLLIVHPTSTARDLKVEGNNLHVYVHTGFFRRIRRAGDAFTILHSAGTLQVCILEHPNMIMMSTPVMYSDELQNLFMNAPLGAPYEPRA